VPQCSRDRRVHLRAANARSAKKEAKRLEKEAKLAAKSQKAAVGAVTDKKAKAEKVKKEEEPAFVNTTPKGEKKGAQCVWFVELAVVDR
jgi:peptidoglycan hydrolase CwlO-like protein